MIYVQHSVFARSCSLMRKQVANTHTQSQSGASPLKSVRIFIFFFPSFDEG